MSCCQDNTNEVQLSPRSKYVGKVEQEPVKFKVLNFLGLKEYLIDKYVFVRNAPKYEIEEKNGALNFKTSQPIEISSHYEQQLRLIEDQHNSVYAISLNLKDRTRYSGTVIYSHGNSSDLSYSLSFISKFASSFPKFDYIVYEYTGYGKTSQKRATQESICEDLNILIQNIVPNKSEVILWGFSLGCYPTAKLASRGKFKGIILQSPMASIYSLFSQNLTVYSIFNNDCFSILENIKQINSFLVLVHSKDDEIIPFHHSEVLYEKHRMSSSNPYCFLVEVTALKHNHMHIFLTDPKQNKIKDAFHSYLNLMIESKNISKGRQLQIQKDKYLDEIYKYKEVQHIDVSCKEIKEDKQENVSLLRQSINFVDIKDNFVFEIDDITPEAQVQTSNTLESNSKKHKTYFTQSQEAKDQSEASDINEEDRMNDVTN